MHGDYQNNNLLMKIGPGTCQAATRPYKVQYYIGVQFSVNGAVIFNIIDKKPDKISEPRVKSQESRKQQ